MWTQCIAQTRNLTLTFDLLTPKSIEILSGHSQHTCVKYQQCMTKRNRVIMQKRLKVSIPSLTLTFDLKIIRGPPLVMVNTYVKYHHCMPKGNGIIVQTLLKVWSPNLTLIFDTKINGGPPRVIVDKCVNYHNCRSKGKRVIMQQSFFHRQTDGWTDKRTDSRGETSIPPTTSLAWGIIKTHQMKTQFNTQSIYIQM